LLLSLLSIYIYLSMKPRLIAIRNDYRCTVTNIEEALDINNGETWVTRSKEIKGSRCSKGSALYLNSFKSSLLIVNSSTLLSHIQSFDISLSIPFLALPLLRFLMFRLILQVTRGLQTSGCLRPFIFSLSPFPVVKNSSLLNYS